MTAAADTGRALAVRAAEDLAAPDPSGALEAAAEDLARILAALAPNTRRAYGGHARRFAAWAGSHGLRSINDRAIADYLAALRDAGAAPATVKQAAAALRAVGRALGLDVSGPLATAEVRRTTRENRANGRGAAAPAGWGAADAAAALAAKAGDLAGLRDAAIVRTVSDGMLRVSEAAGLNLEDLERRDDGSASLAIRASKTDQAGEGAAVFLGPPTVAAIDRYTAAAGIESGALFRRVLKGGHPHPSRLSPDAVRSILAARLRDAGVSGNVSGHSLRRGAAVSLVRAGADLAATMQAGRWADARTVARYTAGEEASKGAVARLRYGG